MRLRNTILTGATSYLQMGSLMVTQLVAIPLALRFLDNERFGLWSFTSQSLGYLMLLDFGVTSSLGRLLAEPIHQGNAREANGWFNLVLAVLTLQGALILGLGLALVEPILHWFNIPAALQPEARQLWLMMLGLNALSFPLRLCPGILAAQNRSYWVFVSLGVGVWAGLAAFYVFLKLGWGSLAYGFSAVAQSVVVTGLPLVAVWRGPNRFRISLRGIPWQHARELFGFSSAIFVMGIAIQVMFMSQSLIITKILGLGAVASFAVCSKVPMLLMQLINRPFDAFNPRWQIYWAQGQTEPLVREYRRMLRFTLGLAALAMICCLATNRWFVLIFGKESLYAGKPFDFFFTLFVMGQVWLHCVSYNFVLAKRMKTFAAVVVADTVLSLGFSIAGTAWFGLTGYTAFTAVYTLAGLSFWYISLKSPRLLNLSPGSLLQDSKASLLFFPVVLLGSLLVFQRITSPRWLVAVEAGAVVIALAWFVVSFRPDLQGMLLRLNRARKNQGAANPPA
jgi:O-antigen/teichoic acid export membrane protein